MKIDWALHIIDQIVEMYTEEGWSLKRLAEKHGVQPKTIRLLLTKQGVRIRQGGMQIGEVGYEPTQEEIAAAIKPLREHQQKYPPGCEKRFGKMAGETVLSPETIRAQSKGSKIDEPDE